ncbi:MAG: hypothetical protein HYV32_01350 [Candidatus Kerfeldbacteria bacterium]|nr:hypothetical protein [Candidatus Kerfeldbacteria bacterium]
MMQRIFFILVGICAPIAASAATSKLLSGDTGKALDSTGLGKTDPVKATAFIINTVLGIIALLAVALLIYGGFRYMSSRGNPQEVDKAKNVLKATIAGLVLVMVAWSITTYVIGKIQKATNGESTSSTPTSEEDPDVQQDTEDNTYEIGYNDGWNIGYGDEGEGGYADGYGNGYETGYNTGYTETGIYQTSYDDSDKGTDVEYDESIGLGDYADGYADGKNDGEQSGYYYGYEDGYADGYDTGWAKKVNGL